jgi:hypothetical protein
MGKKKSSYQQRDELRRKAFNDTSIYEHENVDDDEAQYEKETVNKKKNLVQQDIQDTVVETRKRVGKPNPPYLGTRVTIPGKPTKHGTWRGRTRECMNLIDVLTENHFGYQTDKYVSLLGYAAIAALYEFYGKHNLKFYKLSVWNVVMNHFFMTHIAPILDKTNPNTLVRTFLGTLKILLYRLRNDPAPLLAEYGPAFLPRAFYLVNNKKVFIHKIPLRELKRAQESFDSKRPITRLYGPGYSSDNSGDGPEPSSGFENYEDEVGFRHLFDFTPIDNVMTVGVFHPSIDDFELGDIFVSPEDQDRFSSMVFRYCDAYVVSRALDSMALINSTDMSYFVWYVSEHSHIVLDIVRLYPRTQQPYVVRCYGCISTAIINPDYVDRFAQLNGNNGSWTNTDDVKELIRVMHENYVRFLRRLGVKMVLLERSNLTRLALPAIDLWFFFLINIFEIIYTTFCFSYHISTIYFTFYSVLKITLFIYNVLRFFLLFNYYQPIVYFVVFSAVILFYNKQPEVVEDEVAVSDYDTDSDDDFDPNDLNDRFSEIVSDERRAEVINHFNDITIRRRRGGMKWSGVVNKGTGGKSKVNRPPQAPEDYNPDDHCDPNEPEILEREVRKLDPKKYGDFVYSDFPKLKSTFKLTELNNQMVVFDGHGAPFCGMVCIDLAAGVLPDLESYLKRVSSLASDLDCGTDEYLNQYANHRGYNFAYIDQAGNMMRYPNNPAWEYIVLKFVGDDDQNGHWLLMVDPEGSRSYVNASYLYYDPIVVSSWLMGLIKIVRNYRMLRQHSNAHDYDHRQSINKRDPVEVIEVYVDLRCETNLHVFGFMVPFNDQFIRALLITGLGHLFNLLNFVHLQILMVLNGGPALALYLRFVNSVRFSYNFLLQNFVIQILLDMITYLIIEFGKKFSERSDFEFTISGTRAKRIIEEAEGCREEDRLKCLSLYNNMRFVHDTVNVDRLKLNTLTYCEDVIKNMKPKVTVHGTIPVAVNANSCTTVIPNLPNIILNQIQGRRGGGLFSKRHYNHVKSCRIKKIIRNKVVATSPTIRFISQGKQLGPGNIPVTDSIGEVMAFMRSMVRNIEDVDEDEIEKFTDFSKKFIDRIIQTVDVSQIVEEDPCEYFAKHYKGKRSKNYIEGIVKGYKEMLKGEPPKNFLANQCFVKCENSAKVSGKTVRTRPRLIMVMNNKTLVEMCQVIDIIDAWNDSYFNKFQIKHITPKEMIERVEYISNRKHIVTDYSSFECSISHRVRMIENYAIMELLKKAGLTKALENFKENQMNNRILKTKYNTFNIDSRNSGDFHTSWMNGLQNVLLSAYCYKHEHPEDVDLINFQMVAEGDDGLRAPCKMDVELTERLGFGFSQAVNGTQPGDVDFLRVRWLGGKRYLNIARCLKIAWVLKGPISQNQAKAIQRCAALSLHHISPGHPILWAICKRICRETAGVSLTKAVIKHLNSEWNEKNKDLILENFSKDLDHLFVPDETMRAAIALGTTGFPPISIDNQIALEHSIVNGSSIIEIGEIFREYDDIVPYLHSDEWLIDHHTRVKDRFSKDVREVLKTVDADLSNIVEEDYVVKSVLLSASYKDPI